MCQPCNFTGVLLGFGLAVYDSLNYNASNQQLAGCQASEERANA